VTLVGDRERERALAALRQHYVRGRLTADELEERSAVAVVARTRAELRTAQRELPLDLGPRARRAARSAALGAIATLWMLVSGFLALCLLVAELVDPGWPPVAVVALLWLLTTATAWKLARRVRTR
jgi:hypothetical protein